MNWMKRHLIYINMVKASALMLMTCTMFLGSCTSESGTGSPDVTPVVPNKPTNNTETAVSQDEILLQVVDQMAETRTLGTKAITYSNANLITEGSFRLSAYYHEGQTPYISNSKVKYFLASLNHWRFCDESDIVLKYFWPPIANQTNANPAYEYLDFFAYIPATIPSYITSGIGYTYTNGPSFTCSMPLSDSHYDEQAEGYNVANIKEFAYGLTKNLTKGNTVDISFQHPFATIIVALSRAKLGMTLNSVAFNGIRYNETFTHGNTPQWTATGSTGNFVMTVDKTMGTDLPNGVLGGPYLVVPQAFANSTQTITLNVTYPSWTTVPADTGNVSYAADTSPGAAPYTYNVTVTMAIESWVAANSYTYTIDLGEDDNTVNIGVTVQEWDNKGNHTTVIVD